MVAPVAEVASVVLFHLLLKPVVPAAAVAEYFFAIQQVAAVADSFFYLPVPIVAR